MIRAHLRNLACSAKEFGMTDSNRRALVFGIAMSALAPALASAQPAGISFTKSELFIESGGKRHHFTVEFADTDERRALGLMYRTQMAPDAGMLFDFKKDQDVAMWMRNTRIPLDMLFITRDGRVANIAQRAVPFSEATIPSAGPVRAVLELNGGTAEKLGLKPGDRVIHPLFRNT
jgi:uncharacterized membrane protein (UPF0127 family)